VLGSRRRPLSKAEAGVIASHDQLQMQPVPLLGLLRQTRLKAQQGVGPWSRYIVAA
jgi:hypothetical protein